MKHFYFILVAISLLLLSGCGSMGNIPTQEVRTVKNYDWTPPMIAPAKSSDVTLLLVKPSFAKQFENEKEPIFKKFRENMGVDFEEMLIARGYSIRGPFASYDEIVFKDKQDADLLMRVEIDFNYEAQQGALKYSADFASAMLGKEAYKYRLDGNLYVGGKVNIIVYEPSTKEKLWIKSISLEDKTIYLKTKKYSYKNDCFKDAGYLNAMQSVLDEYYQSAMDLGWKYLEPAELKQLKAQVKAIRSKKTYN